METNRAEGSDSREEHDRSTADQLAELQLLTRLDHESESNREEQHPPVVRGGSTLMLDTVEHPDEEELEDNGGERSVKTRGSSSFTALLAASRRLAGTDPTNSSATESMGGTNCPDSPRRTHFPQDDRARRPTCLPTLIEDEAEPATEDDPESRSQSEPDDTSKDTNEPREAEKESEQDNGTSDPAFEQMLEQLPFDLSFLALSVTDLSVRNLTRARDTIAQSSMPIDSSQQEDSSRTKPPLSNMRMVRTLLCLDTLRLFLLRYEEEEVLLAVTDAIRRIYAQYVREHGVGPLSHSHCVVTASNISRVVLLVRDTLKKHDAKLTALTSQEQHLIDNNTAEQCSPTRVRRGHSSPTKLTITSPSSRSFYSPSYVSSPKLSLSPRSATPVSPRSPGSTSSSTSLRRSILASDGAHVLMNEKLVMYQHHGDVNRLPSFKVRRESDDEIEEAARRRQRSMQYGHELIKYLR